MLALLFAAGELKAGTSPTKAVPESAGVSDRLHNCKYVFDLNQQQEVSLLNPIVIQNKRVELLHGAFEYQGSFPLSTRLQGDRFVDLGHKVLVFCEPRSKQYKVVLVPRKVAFSKPLREATELVFDVSARITEDETRLLIYHPVTGKLCAEIPDRMLEMHKHAASYMPHHEHDYIQLPIIDLTKKSTNVQILMGDAYDLRTDNDFKYLGLDLSMQGQGYRVFLFGNIKGELYAVCTGPATEVRVDGKCPPITSIGVEEDAGSPRVKTADGRVYKFKSLQQKSSPRTTVK